MTYDDDDVPSGNPPEGPIDLDETWREITIALKDMGHAANAAGLGAAHPERYIMRLFRTQVTAVAHIIFAMAQEARKASEVLAARRLVDDAAMTYVIATNRRLVKLCVVTVALAWVGTAAVFALALYVEHPRASDAVPLEVEFSASDNGIITCPTAARSADGAYHCSMQVVLKRQHR